MQVGRVDGEYSPLLAARQLTGELIVPPSNLLGSLLKAVLLSAVPRPYPHTQPPEEPPSLTPPTRVRRFSRGGRSTRRYRLNAPLGISEATPFESGIRCRSGLLWRLLHLPHVQTHSPPPGKSSLARSTRFESCRFRYAKWCLELVHLVGRQPRLNPRTLLGDVRLGGVFGGWVWG